jgi:hypothetical protein
MSTCSAKTARACALFKARNAAAGPVPHRLAFVFALLATMLAGLTGAAADIYVMESSTTGMRVGARLAAEDTITLPASNYVRVVLPSGKTQSIHGPFTGKVSDISKGVKTNERLIDFVRRILETGGSMETTYAATRSTTLKTERPRAFSLVEIPSWVNGKICLLKGGNVAFARQLASGIERAVLVDAKSFERGQVTWETGSATAVWPESLKLLPDASYQVLMQDREGRDVRFLDKAPEDDDMLVELYKLGCTYQLETWLRERMLTGISRP